MGGGSEKGPVVSKLDLSVGADRVELRTRGREVTHLGAKAQDGTPEEGARRFGLEVSSIHVHDLVGAPLFEPNPEDRGAVEVPRG
jgi:peptide methionine sulfoxide reductase MsrB